MRFSSVWILFGRAHESNSKVKTYWMYKLLSTFAAVCSGWRRECMLLLNSQKLFFSFSQNYTRTRNTAAHLRYVGRSLSATPSPLCQVPTPIFAIHTKIRMYKYSFNAHVRIVSALGLKISQIKMNGIATKFLPTFENIVTKPIHSFVWTHRLGRRVWWRTAQHLKFKITYTI